MRSVLSRNKLQKTQTETLESYTPKLNSTWDSLTRKYSVERPIVNKQYVLNCVNATFFIICEDIFQEDHCLWTARARMLGCLLIETRSCRKNRNTTLRLGDVYRWKPMLLKLHFFRCWSFTPYWRANNALARVSQFCIGMHAVVNRAWCSIGAGVPPSTDVRTLLRIVLSSCRR